MLKFSQYDNPDGAAEAGGPPTPSKETIMRTSNQKMEQRAQSNWSEQQKLALACRILADEGHGASLAGQVTCRADNSSSMWTQPYGLGLEEIKASDYLLVSEKLALLKGSQLPNPANNFHLHIYDQRLDVNCIIHTHPPHTAALAMIGEELVIAHMDVMCFYDAVNFLPDWPGVAFSDEEGTIIAKALRDKSALLLAHHGLLVTGGTIEEATYRAVFFERAARMQLLAMSTGSTLKKVEKEKGEEARGWRMSRGPVLAHFEYFTRQALQRHADCLF